MDWLPALLIDYGYPLVFLGPLLENAGLPVPGDAALFWTSFFASQGHFRIEWVIGLAVLGAILGDNAGYWIARRGGRPLLERWALRRSWIGRSLERSESFFHRHGGKTVFFARFVPALRICGALVAGASLMPWRRFLLWNCLGAVAWAGATGLLGYALGLQFDWVRRVTDNLWIAGVVAGGFVVLLFYVQYRAGKRLSA